MKAFSYTLFMVLNFCATKGIFWKFVFLVENAYPVQFYAGFETFSGKNFFVRLKIFNQLI